MYYWNQQNFEGLKSIGNKYVSIQEYEAFGRYCLLKEQGLKKQAVAAVKEFVASAKEKSIETQRKIASEIASLGFWNDEIHQLIAHPLQVYLQEVLSSWAVEEKTDATPYRWLGYISGDLSAYENALVIDPEDEICITRLAQAHLNDVDYQTHHLSESHLLGELSDAKHSLREAEILIESLKTEKIKSSMQEELGYFNRMLDSWEEYSKLETKVSFPEWCAIKGKKFNFWSIVYYDK